MSARHAAGRQAEGHVSDDGSSVACQYSIAPKPSLHHAVIPRVCGGGFGWNGADILALSLVGYMSI